MEAGRPRRRAHHPVPDQGPLPGQEAARVLALRQVGACHAGLHQFVAGSRRQGDCADQHLQGAGPEAPGGGHGS
eukprot:377061-Lingulodinium_polyedra.AAC.1